MNMYIKQSTFFLYGSNINDYPSITDKMSIRLSEFLFRRIFDFVIDLYLL